MKKFLALCLCAACLILPVRAAAAPGDSAAAAIVYHAPSGLVLTGHNELAQLPMASTTKIMTALVAIERCADLSAPVIIERAWTLIGGSSAYLREGETLTVEELLCALLLASGNDAALALAVVSAGSEEAFVEAMNEKAAQLGLTNTRFENPHGLSSAGHFSCARDMAVLMGAAMENESFRTISAMTSCHIGDRTLRNHNRLLTDCAGVISGKTGYTRAAGRCLVSCCSREGLELICVTLGDRRDWDDHSALYDWAYEDYRGFSIESGAVWANVPIIGGESEHAAVIAAQGVQLCLPRGEAALLTADLPRFLYAPVFRGDAAGTLRLHCGGELIAELPLRYRDDVAPLFEDGGQQKE